MKQASAIKTKKCRICANRFPLFRSTQQVCSPECAQKHAENVRVKRERVELRLAKERIKTKAEWAREAQSEFNSYIRFRDKDSPCISCNRHHGGQYHCGHYRSIGSSPELRFEESNCHKQCAPCNNHLSGNIIEYRKALIRKIGIASVEYLEGPHDPKHYTIDDLKAIKATYKAKLKELMSQRLTASA